MTDIPKDTSILRCAVKKSWSVAKKVGLCVCAILVVLIACYCIYLGVTSQTASKICVGFTTWIVSAYNISADIVCKVALSIPWEIWVIASAVLAIFVYSLLWCIARNFTEEDWKSDKANVAVAFAAFAFAAFAFAFAFVAFAAFVVFAFVAFVVDPADRITTWYYVFRFLGAYLNYRDRIKNGGK